MNKIGKKKLAVLFGGELREIDTAYKSWTFLDDITYDIFFSTWDMSIQKYDALGIYLYEEVTEDRIKKYFPNAIISIETDNFLKNNVNAKLSYHWRKLFHMMDIMDVEYEYIILTRPDLYTVLYGDFKLFLDNIQNDRIYGSNIQIYPPPKLGYINDVFFIGDYISMRRAFLTFTPFINEDDDDIHRKLFKHFASNDIYIQDIEILHTLVIRAAHRGLMHLTLSELREIEMEFHNSMNSDNPVKPERTLFFLEQLKNKNNNE